MREKAPRYNSRAYVAPEVAGPATHLSRTADKGRCTWVRDKGIGAGQEQVHMGQAFGGAVDDGLGEGYAQGQGYSRQDIGC